MAGLFSGSPNVANAFKSLMNDPAKVIFDVWLNPNDPECFARLTVIVALTLTALFVPYIIGVAFRSLERQYKADMRAAAKWKPSKGDKSPRSNIPANISAEAVAAFKSTRKSSRGRKASKSKSPKKRSGSKSASKSKSPKKKKRSVSAKPRGRPKKA